MPGGGSTNVITISKPFDIPSVDTLVSGLMIVNVKHSTGVGSDEEQDCHKGYADNWGIDPNSVPSAGKTPYYSDTDYSDPPKYPDASTFDGVAPGGADGRRFYEARDEVDESAGNRSLDKSLSMGDYDCYLFYVTCGAHLEQSRKWWVGSALKFHHEGCQSFIKSHLISRINNSSDCDHASDTDLSMFKRGAYRRKDYFASTTASQADFDGTIGANITDGKEYLFSNGDYHHQMYRDGAVDDDLPGFGINLGDGNNTFFAPVESIQIGINHPAPHEDTGAGHTEASYGLLVRVHLWAMAGQNDAYFRNRVNVLWQPFGENAGFSDP